MADTLGFHMYANAIYTCMLHWCAFAAVLVSLYTLTFEGQSRSAQHILFSLEIDESGAL